MSKATHEFFEEVKANEPSRGALEAVMNGIKEGLGAYREGLGQVWDGVTPMFDHGRMELAAALFHGNAAHVVYMRDGDTHGQDHSPPREHDGREM